MFKKILLIMIGIISAYSLTIKDSLGRDVNVPDKVNRVIAIGPGALRLVVYMQGSDKVVGIEKKEKSLFYHLKPYMLTHPKLAKLPVIGMGGPNPNPDLERIISLKPDVIFGGYINKFQADSIQNKTQIPVVVLSYGKIGTFAILQ
jgi:iron complex transport system substrate-binding protein